MKSANPSNSGEDDVPTLTPSTSASERIVYEQTATEIPPARVLAGNLVLTGDEPNPAATAYRLLRTQVLQKMSAHGWNVLAVTSPSAGEGKTLTAINLAVSIARTVNYTVLLVDLDFRNPSIHRYLGVEPKAGILDYLLDGVPLTSVLLNPGIDRLVVLPGRSSFLRSAELLASPRMVSLVEELKSRYPSRIVLFDLPPVNSAADAMAFSPYVDASLLVLEEGKTLQADVRQALSYLGSTTVLGAVLNKSCEKIEAFLSC